MTPAECVALLKTLPLDSASRPVNEVASWDDLRHGRADVARSALTAAEELAQSDISLLVRTLDGRDRARVATLMLFIGNRWSDHRGEAWIAASPSFSMRALGAQIWIRDIAQRAGADIAARLERLRVSLATSLGEGDAIVWWQILSIAQRLESRRESAPFILALHDVAAHAIAERSFLPAADEMDHYLASNSCIIAVLPYAAQLGGAEFAERCARVFRTRAAVTLGTDGAYLADTTVCADLLLESCGVALGRALTGELTWWVETVETSLGRPGHWNGRPADDLVNKARWLLAAACIGVIGVLRDTGVVRVELVAQIVAVTRRHLAELFWEAGDGPRSELLAKLLGTALALDAVAGPPLIAQLAREVRSPRLHAAVLEGGGRSLSSDDLNDSEALLQRRVEFYEAMQID